MLEELTINKDGIVEINSGFTEFKNNASIVKLDVTGNASFNSDVSFTENVDIEGILQIQDRDVLGDLTDINGRVVELESGGGGGENLNVVGTLDVTGKSTFLNTVSITQPGLSKSFITSYGTTTMNIGALPRRCRPKFTRIARCGVLHSQSAIGSITCQAHGSRRPCTLRI